MEKFYTHTKKKPIHGLTQHAFNDGNNNCIDTFERILRMFYS